MDGGARRRRRGACPQWGLRGRRGALTPGHGAGETAARPDGPKNSPAASEERVPREAFRKLGIHYRVADRAKSDLYRDLLPLIYSNRVELLDDGRLRAQLLRLERRTSRAGKDTIDHPPRAHDDVANAVAGVANVVGGCCS